MEMNGKQYVVIYAGGHHLMETPIGDELIACHFHRRAY